MIENLQVFIKVIWYGLQSTVWVLGKDVHTPGVTRPLPTERYTLVTPHEWKEYIQRHTTGERPGRTGRHARHVGRTVSDQSLIADSPAGGRAVVMRLP